MSPRENPTHTVGSVARTAGISVRTLHHYDQIGLLKPGGRSAAGYRLYQSSDLERLQEILFFRELDLGLPEIQRLIDDPRRSRLDVLRLQRQRLEERRTRLQAIIKAIDQAIDGESKEPTMNKHDLLEVFDGFDPSVHQAEAEQRWGKTDAFKTAGKRTQRYTKEDWQRIKDEENAISEEFARLMETGEAASSEPAADVAERHRLHIDQSYYPCSTSMHVGLGDMYVADPRFTAHWDQFAPGLAEFVSEAIATNAMRSSGSAD